MNEVWCSDAFAPKYILRNVLSLLQGHYLLESDDGITFDFIECFTTTFSARSLLAKLGRDDGITINRDIGAVFGPEMFVGV